MNALILLALLASPSAESLLVVVNKPASTVSIVDLVSGRIAATLPTGASPHETAASPDGRWAVVSDYGAQTPGSTLTVVDLKSRTVARTIQVGFLRPHGIMFLPDSRTVLVTSETDGMVVQVDVLSGTVRSRHPTGQAVSHMLALAPDGRRAYTANIRSGSISSIPLSDSAAPATLPVGSMTEAIGLRPDGREAWVGSNNTGKVFAVDIGAWRVVDSMQTSGFPYRIAFAPDGRSAIITNPMSDEAHIYDGRTRERRGTVALHGSGGQPGEPLAVVFSPDGRTAWISLGGADEIAEVDVEARTVRRYLPAGAGPDGMALVIG